MPTPRTPKPGSGPRALRPTREALAAAEGKVLRDVLAPGLAVVFCGINPGLYSGATGHHFARPGNRFWPALHGSGFTDRLLHPSEDRGLLGYGLGVTNMVARTTARADELSGEELRAGAARLAGKLRRWRPVWAAFLGLGAYGAGYGVKSPRVGPQEGTIGGVRVWVLPNPSGLNANYGLGDFVRLFGELRAAALRGGA